MGHFQAEKSSNGTKTLLDVSPWHKELILYVKF